MKKQGQFGAFIVPTGVGASVGGFAGDASLWARKFAKCCNRLIVNPNVVNAGCFSGMTENMLYVEGYILDEFFKGKVSLIPSQNNKIGVVFDKSISQEVLNIHINTINAVKTVYGIDISGYEITGEDAGVDFFIDESGISAGSVKNLKTVLNSARNLVKKGANAIAIVCRFKDEVINENYKNGIGVDPVGGVEAVISHYISRELKIPAAHSPAFDDFSISTEVTDPRVSAEYITPSFLPCVLLGLANAPQICEFHSDKLNINDLDFLIMPHDCLGSTPVFEALKRKIKIYAVKENSTVLNINKKTLFKNSDIIEIESYKVCPELIR